MGKIGEIIGSHVGEFAGSYLGNRVAGEKGSKAGGEIGKAVGGFSLLPFKTGGRVPGKRGKPIKILAHSGEYILPVGVAPTKMQKKAVAQKKSKAKKSKK